MARFFWPGPAGEPPIRVCDAARRSAVVATGGVLDGPRDPGGQPSSETGDRSRSPSPAHAGSETTRRVKPFSTACLMMHVPRRARGGRVHPQNEDVMVASTDDC